MMAAMRIEALVPKSDFLHAPEVAHLCAGGETPVLRSHAAAIERFLQLKSEGMRGREEGIMGMLARCRGRVAALLGVEVGVARQWGEEPALERIAAAMDGRTRVLSVSQVSYLTGRRYRLEDLRALFDRGGALLSVDATHATGVLPVAARHADVLVSSCYKFLLGVHGAAIFYRNPQRLADLPPQSIGWPSMTGARTVAEPLAYRLRPDAARFEA